MTIYTTAEAAERLCVTPAAVRIAARNGYIQLRQPTTEERARLYAAGRYHRQAYYRTLVVDAAELERYARDRRPVGRPRKEIG